MKVLLIKTSSMGDVIHTLPALTDAARDIRALLQRVSRRARARVQVTPAELSAVRDVARLCYQDHLERDPALSGVVYLELRDDRAAVAGAPRHPALASCIAERATPFMRKQHILSATIALTAPVAED